MAMTQYERDKFEASMVALEAVQQTLSRIQSQLLILEKDKMIAKRILPTGGGYAPTKEIGSLLKNIPQTIETLKNIEERLSL